MIYYSPSTGGFYRFKIHTNIPSDSVEITDEEHAKLIKGQSDGKRIVFENGKPTLKEEKESLDSKRKRTTKLLEMNMKHYIFVEHGYNEVTQSTLQRIASNSKSNKAMKDAAKQILDWIIETVLVYYYNKKDQIAESVKPEKVQWDFKECDSTAPKLTLKQILQMKK